MVLRKSPYSRICIRIPSAENSHRPRVVQGSPPAPRPRPVPSRLAPPRQAGGRRQPPACPVSREGGASRGRLQGCGSRGSAGGGAQLARGGAGRLGCRRRSRGRGGQQRRRPRQLRRDLAGQRPVHGEREVRAAQRSHVSVPAVSGGRGQGGGRARRFWCLPRLGSPGSAAPAEALFRIAPSPGPRPRGVVPPLLSGAEDAHKSRRLWACRTRRCLLPSRGKAQAACAPGLWGGPGLRVGPWRQPGPWHGRSPGAPLPSP